MENFRGVPGEPDKVISDSRNLAEIARHKLAIEALDDIEALEFERPKTLNETIVAHWLNKKLPGFLDDYGLESPKILTASLIRMIDDKRATHEEIAPFIERGGSGSYIVGTNRIYILSTPDDLLRSAHVMTHELIHAHSFDSVETKLDDSDSNTIVVSQRRFGLIIFINDEQASKFFMFLNEAITEELTKRFAEKHFGEMSLITEDFKKIQEAVKPHGMLDGMLDGTPMNQLLDEEFSDQRFYCYPNERGTLAFIINDIFNHNPGQFSNHDEIFKIFTRAMLHGELLPLARIIDKTYGKGMFRRIAEMTAIEQPDFATAILEFIGKALKQIRQNKKAD